MPRHAPTVRRKEVRFALGPETIRALDTIVRVLDGESRADGVRAAINITSRIVRESQAGGRIVLIRDGVQRELLLAVPFAEAL